ncbi:rhomboid family intramembrane serine protease [Falsiroseomonas sp.]|uniref:rhomboid family intramembrane serine protease n=1 Tax=Falsiroseomonas sp. TaxID=2870721 RepID=UPI003564E492
MLLADHNHLARIRAPHVTIGLIVVCSAVFLAEAAGLQVPGWIAFNPEITARFAHDPRAWAGVLGHALLHGGLLHLFGNMLALWVFGDNVEDAFGHGRFALFFAACVAAGAAAYALTAPPNHALVGASGGIAGVMASYLLLYPRARVVVLVLKGLPVAVPASWFVGIWLAANIVHAAAMLGPEEPGVMPTAWFAHLGGFAAGLALTLFARPAGVRLFQPGPAGDAQGWLLRRAIDLSPASGRGWSWEAALKALAFLLLAGLGMLFAI